MLECSNVLSNRKKAGRQFPSILQPRTPWSRCGAIGSEPAIPPSAVVTVVAISGLHVVMIMVHGPFTDHVAKLVRLDITMVMIVMDNVGVAVAIDPRDSILFIFMRAYSRTSQHERSDCQGPQGCLFHERFGEPTRQVIHYSARNCFIAIWLLPRKS
jgi:hypothetical protein